MKSRHPIRILVEVLVVVLLFAAVIRIYLWPASDKGAADADQEVTDVERVMRERAGNEGESGDRVFGREPRATPMPAADDAGMSQAMAVLLLDIRPVDTDQTLNVPFDLVSEDCGWRHAHTGGVVRLMVPPGTCTYQVEATAETGMDLISDPVEITARSGEVVRRTIPVAVAPLPAEEPVVGGINLSWSRGQEWIEISSVIPGGSLALAGLQAGDIIVAVNGVSVGTLSDQALADLLVGPLEQTVRLTLAVQEGSQWVEVPVDVPREPLEL